MRRTMSIVAALSAASLGAAVTAQQPPPSFTAATRTVAVYATVTNAQGRLVPDLSRDDFSIDDDGKRQTLTVFSNDVQPITVVMLLDRSGSMKPNFDLEEQAAEAFVRAMGPADKARIGSFAAQIQIDPPEFSSDRDALVNVLRTGLQTDGPTPLWNAVDTAIDKLILEPGRRVVLVFTDGVDMPLNFSGRNKSLKDVMKRAEERDVMVYAIGLAGETGMPDLRGRTPDRGGRGGLGGPGGFGGPGGRGLGGDRAATREARRRAAEDRRGHRRRLLRADVGARSSVDVRADRRRAPSSVRARIHPGDARRQDARADGPRVLSRISRCGRGSGTWRRSLEAAHRDFRMRGAILV